jgi:hypothetical protein
VLRGDTAHARELGREALATWPGLAATGLDQLLTALIASAEGAWVQAEQAARNIPDHHEGKNWSAPVQRTRLLVEALLAQGKVAEARAELERNRAKAGEPAPDVDASLTRDILEAAVRGSGASADEVKAAVHALAKLAARADQAGYVLLARMADIERGRLLVAAHDPSGRPFLEELMKKTDRLHLGALTAHARSILGT